MEFLERSNVSKAGSPKAETDTVWRPFPLKLRLLRQGRKLKNELWRVSHLISKSCICCPKNTDKIHVFRQNTNTHYSIWYPNVSTPNFQEANYHTSCWILGRVLITIGILELKEFFLNTTVWRFFCCKNCSVKLQIGGNFLL